MNLSLHVHLRGRRSLSHILHALLDLSLQGANADRGSHKASCSFCSIHDKPRYIRLDADTIEHHAFVLMFHSSVTSQGHFAHVTSHTHRSSLSFTAALEAAFRGFVPSQSACHNYVLRSTRPSTLPHRSAYFISNGWTTINGSANCMRPVTPATEFARYSEKKVSMWMVASIHRKYCL